jgi:cytoskeletal protein CcmA (bactofilin family)
LRLPLVFIACLLALAPLPAAAADIRGGEDITVAAGEVLSQDLYAAGLRVVIAGTVQGDVIAVGSEVLVTGTIEGDLIAAGGTITVQGAVRESLRAAGGEIDIQGPIGGDLLSFGGTVILRSSGTVARDVVSAGGQLTLDGGVDGNVKASGGTLAFNGPVGGAVEAQGDRIRLLPGARIGGDFTYSSSQDLDRQQGAVVTGTTQARPVTTEFFGREVADTQAVRAAKTIFGRLQVFGVILALGFLLLLWLVPAQVQSAAEVARTRTWLSLGVGLLLSLGIPLALFFGALAAFTVLGAAAIPLAGVPVALYLVLLALSGPVAAMALGTWALRALGRPGADAAITLLAGAGIIAVAGLLPLLDALMAIFTILLGFGAWLVLAFSRRFPARPPVAPTAPGAPA